MESFTLNTSAIRYSKYYLSMAKLPPLLTGGAIRVYIHSKLYYVQLDRYPVNDDLLRLTHALDVL